MSFRANFWKGFRRGIVDGVMLSPLLWGMFAAGIAYAGLQDFRSAAMLVALTGAYMAFAPVGYTGRGRRKGAPEAYIVLDGEGSAFAICRVDGRWPEDVDEFLIEHGKFDIRKVPLREGIDLMQAHINRGVSK